MTRYLISFDDGAMKDIREEDLPEVGKAAHQVVDQAKAAGVWITGGGVDGHDVTVVGTDGSVTNDTRPEDVGAHLGGFVILDLPSHEQALEWAAKFAVACRCAQEVWPLMDDPDV